MKAFAVALIFALVMAVGVEAGTGSKLHGTIGFGVGGAGEATGIAGGLGLSMVNRWTIVSARVIGCSEFKIMGKPQYSGDISLMAGIRTTRDGQEASVEGGLGYVRVHYSQTVPSSDPLYGPQSVLVKDDGIGFSLQGKVYYRCVGLTVYGNINGMQSYVGSMLTFRIGQW
jgi:hypothetical protein